MNETHPAAISIGYANKRQRAIRTDRPCEHIAPCGCPCAMNGNKRHIFHTCEDAACKTCHGKERFEKR